MAQGRSPPPPGAFSFGESGEKGDFRKFSDLVKLVQQFRKNGVLVRSSEIFEQMQRNRMFECP